MLASRAARCLVADFTIADFVLSLMHEIAIGSIPTVSLHRFNKPSWIALVDKPSALVLHCLKRMRCCDVQISWQGYVTPVVNECSE
jgi:hypothetical protein